MFRFIRGIAEGKTITVYGDGSQERDFTHVEDAARGTVAALRPLGFAVVNLGGERPVPLTRIISYIEALSVSGRTSSMRNGTPPIPRPRRQTYGAPASSSAGAPACHSKTGSRVRSTGT